MMKFWNDESSDTIGSSCVQWHTVNPGLLLRPESNSYHAGKYIVQVYTAVKALFNSRSTVIKQALNGRC